MQEDRLYELNPYGLYKIEKNISIIWRAIDSVYEQDSFSVRDFLVSVEIWCEQNIGYRHVGVIDILEVGYICINNARNVTLQSDFLSEYIYELELFGFVICAYFGFDYKEVCKSIGRETSFDYNPCMIYSDETWISEDKCYLESVKLIENHNSEYENRLKELLGDFVSIRKPKTRKPHEYKKFQFPTDVNKYNTTAKRFNDEIKRRIRRTDKFEEYKFKLDFLENHQRAGCLLAERYDKFAFFYDTGTGKTIMSLAIISEKQRKNNASFLILAPLSIIENAWLEDSYNYFPKMKILPLSSNFSKEDYKDLYYKWEEAQAIPPQFFISAYEWDYFNKKADYENTIAFMKLLCMADHYIINIEKYRRNPEEYLFNKINGLIIDESALLKNPYTTSSKTIDKYSDEYEYIYLLSGKPAPNNSFEYYMQMKLVDEEDFNMSPEDFKQAFFTYGERGIVFKNERFEEICAAMISQRSLIVSKEDCLRLKKQHEIIVPVELDKTSLARYQQVMKGCFEKIEEEKEYNLNNRRFLATSRRLAIVTKLREVSSGFIIKSNDYIEKIHDKKEEAIIQIIKKYPGEQFVIWCNFIYEIERLSFILSRYGRVVDAYGKTKHLQRKIKDFKDRKARFLIAHPKTLKYGVTLVNCQRAIYYSLSYSAEDYYQSHDRIYRMGQKNECYFYFILAQNTIDETIFDCVKNKMGYAELFQEIVKHAAKNGVNYKDEEEKELDRNAFRKDYNTIKNTFDFMLSGDASFSYSYGGEERNSILRNTTLTQFDTLFPEEMLFEIACDLLYGGLKSINYHQITRASEWVRNQLKKYHIVINRRIRDYLDEQEDKQYQQDEARGLMTFKLSNDSISKEINKITDVRTTEDEEDIDMFLDDNDFEE